MCEEDSEDTEAVAKLFEINDSIHRTIQRYKLIKEGDVDGANKIPQGTLGRSGAGVKQGANNQLNLIDFGEPEPAPAPAAAESSGAASGQPAGKGNALEDDLLGLSLGGDSYGQSGSIALGGSNGSVLGLSGMAVPQQQKASNQAITDLFAAGPRSTPPPQQISSPPSATFSPGPAQPSRNPDPFAALTSTPRQGSPFQYQQSVKPPAPASAAVDLLGGEVAAPTSNLAQTSTSAANDDDEWTFASSVPDSSKEITVVNSSINVLFNVSRETDTALLINSRVSNNTPLPISGLTLQVAASKVSSKDS